MKCGVLGGGFGLYGWLPALVSSQYVEAWTLRVYEPRIAARPALASLLPRINWADSVDELVANVGLLVVARRPADQERLVHRLSAQRWHGDLLLEKPLAPTPFAAQHMLDALDRASIGAAVGYTLAECWWATDVAAALRDTTALRVRMCWRFFAHHYAHSLSTWKRAVAAGGGALRFYGIHLVALLAPLGDWDVTYATPLDDGGEDPRVVFALRGGDVSIEVEIDSAWSGAPQFSIRVERPGQPMHAILLADPFDPAPGTPANADADRRIAPARRLVASALAEAWTPMAELRRPVQLWQTIEHVRGLERAR